MWGRIRRGRNARTYLPLCARQGDARAVILYFVTLAKTDTVRRLVCALAAAVFFMFHEVASSCAEWRCRLVG